MDIQTGLVEHSRRPRNAETPLARLRQAFLTPQRDFYIRNHGPVPNLREDAYRLTVGGDVRTALDLSLGDIRSRFAPRTVSAVMQCAGNRRSDMLALGPVEGDPWAPGAIGNAEWTGAALADILAAAGVDEAAGLHVAFEAHDETTLEGERFRYGVSIPLAKALEPDVLLAWAMNGEPLSPEHGFPLRAVVPGYAGARSPKWLAAIRVQEEESANPIQQKEYRLFAPGVCKETAAAAPNTVINEMPVNSAICEPAAGSEMEAGPVRVRGYAIATGHGVGRVEVSPDGANWHEAELEEAGSRWSWVFWSVVLDLPAGRHDLRVRAFDKAGGGQPADLAEVWNFKGYLANSWHCVDVLAKG